MEELNVDNNGLNETDENTSVQEENSSDLENTSENEVSSNFDENATEHNQDYSDEESVEEQETEEDNSLSARLKRINQEKESYAPKRSLKGFNKNLKEILSNMLAVIYLSIASVVCLLGVIFFNGIKRGSVDEMLLTSCNIMIVFFGFCLALGVVLLIVSVIMNIIRKSKEKRDSE